MQKEYDESIMNGTWRLVYPHVGIKPIGCKWDQVQGKWFA